tara:strand:- start:86 stop:331 length:246 start_codon:yes stop_codon:yes gene_type:complete
MIRNEKGNTMDWELELIGMKRPATEAPYNLGGGQDTNVDFFKTEDDFDETIYDFLDENRNEFKYNKTRRQINYLREQRKIL